MSQPRPKITDEIRLEAARRLCEGTHFEPEHVAKVYWGFMDGFELAKALEDEGYEIKTSDVETLDSMSHYIHAVHKEECWKWVKENNIQPEYPVGTRLTRGIIEDISEYNPAYYKVKEYGCTEKSRRILVRFEDAELDANNNTTSTPRPQAKESDGEE